VLEQIRQRINVYLKIHFRF